VSERAGIAAILLAAGVGRRFDPTGARLKLLEPATSGPCAGLPLAAAALRSLKQACGDVVAVVRPADTAAQRTLHALLAAHGAQLVLCTDADLGMGHSLACGIRARIDVAGWVIALADMPAVSVRTIAAIRDAIAGGQDTAAPVFRGERGHPVGFGRVCRDELLALEGDSGARSVLAAHPPLLLDTDDPGCLHDIDRPSA
jgi:molybdenum cofactor cytidylyltransferase